MLSVIIFHVDPAILPGGYVGVDIFFVISGYVISQSLANDSNDTLFRYLSAFYRRRMTRLLPALIACLIVTSLVSSAFIPNGWLSEHNDGTALFAAFGLSNLYLVSNTDGYFSSRAEFNPFIHTWSLAVEEQFYLIFPIIFFFWVKKKRESTLSTSYAIYVIIALASTSLALAAYETTHAHQRAFYLLPSRFWELAAGALLFQAQHSF